MQVQQKAIPIIMPCPSCGKKQLNGWQHAACDTAIYLKGNGNILCQKGCTERNICGWRFACESHVGEYEHREVDFNALIDALGTALLATRSYFKDDKEGLLFLAEVQKSVLNSM